MRSLKYVCRQCFMLFVSLLNQVFYGREENLVRLKKYMQDDCDKPLVLHGEGGCGKTSLLAKSAALTSTEWFENCKPVSIIRFLGTTPDSSALTPALISICQQVNTLYTYIDFRKIADLVQCYEEAKSIHDLKL